ncbi:MAG TPA: AI-2E family transporter [Gammaproteobacteria bacterium]|jgi:predicted PurR-regulated permease PerM|nr:AI-2E family transporter [Gammaproteobacteria bacterium]
MSRETKIWLIAGGLGICALLYLLGPILTPFLISALLAWLGDPMADRLEAWKFPRSLAVVVVFIGTFLVLGMLLLLIVPMVGREFAALSARTPEATTWFQNIAAPWLAEHLHLDASRLKIENLSGFLTENIQSASQLAGNTLATVTHSGRMVFVILMNLLLVPVVTFYWLRDWDIFKARVAELLPRDQAGYIERLVRECEGVLAAFFRGQLLVMICLSAIYSVGLAIVGLENAVAIGVIAGLLGFVPYLGITTGVILALLSAVLQGGDWLPLWVLVVFAVGMGLEGMVLTPRLVGGRIGLHPVMVIFAILAGGRLFGFVGVLMALPVAAACMVFARHLRDRYLESEFYRGDGAP